MAYKNMIESIQFIPLDEIKRGDMFLVCRDGIGSCKKATDVDVVSGIKHIKTMWDTFVNGVNEFGVKIVSTEEEFKAVKTNIIHECNCFEVIDILGRCRRKLDFDFDTVRHFSPEKIQTLRVGAIMLQKYIEEVYNGVPL